MSRGDLQERQGLLERDMEGDHLSLSEADDSALSDLQAHSLTYRIALGRNRGCKAFTLQTAPPQERSLSQCLARTAGFSLHAGVRIEEKERGKLEHLCRYIARPPLCLDRLGLTSS